VNPDRWGYTTMKRYVHAVEKVLSVTSYQDTLSPDQYISALQTQYESMRVVKEMRKLGSVGSSSAMGEEDAAPIQTPFPLSHPSSPPGGDEDDSLLASSQAQHQQQQQLEPHTDTPIITTTSSEEPLFVTSPEGNQESNGASSSAMDVDS